MFHLKLLELESELLAKEQSSKPLSELPPECEMLLEFVENEIGTKLGSPSARGWKGWVAYRRKNNSMVICRGRAFRVGGFFGKMRAGLDVAYGVDTITEYERGFDVTPPQDLDHLLLNFGSEEPIKVFLWYGENIAPYRLIYMADVQDQPHPELGNAVVEACTWVLTKPKDQTLPEFLESKRQR